MIYVDIFICYNNCVVNILMLFCERIIIYGLFMFGVYLNYRMWSWYLGVVDLFCK